MSAVAVRREIGLRSTFDICAFIDELGFSANGKLCVNGADGPRGTVFVEGGRVCWAAARGLARRLSELLGARAALAPAAMESLFQQCKAERIPLGEHLVSRGVLSAAQLREALLQHTIESLRHVCIVEGRGAWCPHPGAGYSPRFTFATAEVVARAGAAEHAEVAASVRPLLATLFDEGEWAAAFVRPSGCAFPEPVAVHGRVPHAATALLRMGKWAASVLDVAAVFSGDAPILSVSRASPSGDISLVAFRHGDAVVTGETGAHGPARILNHRAQQRRIGA